MHHSRGNRPVMGARLFDAEVLEVLGEVRRAGWGEELGDGVNGNQNCPLFGK